MFLVLMFLFKKPSVVFAFDEIHGGPWLQVPVHVTYICAELDAWIWKCVKLDTYLD